MKKRIFICILAYSTLTALFTGCGSVSENNPSASVADNTSIIISTADTSNIISTADTSNITSTENISTTTEIYQEDTSAVISDTLNTTNSAETTPVATVQTDETTAAITVTENITTSIPDTSVAETENTTKTEYVAKNYWDIPGDTELQSTYKAAYDFCISKCYSGNYYFTDSAEDTIDVNGTSYTAVSTGYFTDIKGAETYLKQFFTDNYINSNDLLSDFLEKDDTLYVKTTGQKGIDPSYTGCVFSVSEDSADTKTLKSTCYYLKDMNTASDYEFFYSTPSNPDDYNIKELTATFKMVDGNWCVDTIQIP